MTSTKYLLRFGLGLMPVSLCIFLIACSPNQKTEQQNMTHEPVAPGQKYDLTQWNITVPIDLNGDGKADTIRNTDIKDYQHPEYFYLDEEGAIVFVAPNKATTTPNSTNTRSELRQAFLGAAEQSKTPKNYFVLASNPRADEFASVGSRLSATLKVNHVSLNAKYPNKSPAYSVVIGQIHAGKIPELREQGRGFGWGNEPLKISYKKFPHHQTGSVYWTYERNLLKDDPNRIDIDYVAWGEGWNSDKDPGENGIKIGQEFSYEVNVYGDTMYLKFYAQGKPTVEHSINLANNVDVFGDVDEKDHPQAYLEDWLFFKAGAYNQCSTKDAPTFRYPACPGTGNWEFDREQGNYTSVTFSRLELSEPVAP